MEKISEVQRAFFNKGETLTYDFRLKALKQLKKMILENEESICEALKSDLNKSKEESYMCEIGLTLSEISYAISNLKSWMKDKRVKTPLSQFKSKSFIHSEPYGTSLIIAPWNYPVLLLLSPLVGAIASGCTAVLKPSEISVSTSNLLSSLINKYFDNNYIKAVCGDALVCTSLLEEKFDVIFYTGSTRVGKIVLEHASKNLTPCILELGGKSPTIVSKNSNVKLAAKRITFSKLLNAGQTCVEPDYCLVNSSVKDEFISYLKSYNDLMLKNPDDFVKIINDNHKERQKALIDKEKVIFGDYNLDTPGIVILDNVELSDKVMKDEIFGPILPIISYESFDEALNIVKSFEKPLALYLFSNDKNEQRRVVNELSYGGGCINDCIIHLASNYLPFGGVGNSGMGNYHGKYSFDAFSHEKSILKKSTLIDLPMRYMPYSKNKDKLIRKFLK